MANVKYDYGRQLITSGQIDWINQNFKVVLVDAQQYTPNLATHQFLSSIPAGARTATSANLTGKTNTAGYCDADDVEILNVTGPVSEYLIIYKDTGNEATSPLLIFMDTGTNLPFTPNGSALDITWDNGLQKIWAG